MNIRKLFIIIGQMITVSLFLLVGTFLIHLKIPGNGAICDPEQMLLFQTWTIFIVLGIGLLINSYIFYSKGIWKKYRAVIIGIVYTISFLAIFSRGIIMFIMYGEVKNRIESYNPTIKIKLYENGKFFAYTYDASCESENVGTYVLNDERLTLKFGNQKSIYLGNEYTIENSSVYCLDCMYQHKLEMR